MDAATAITLQQQLFQLNMATAMQRAQHQARQGLADMLAENVQALAATNPDHLGSQVDTHA